MDVGELPPPHAGAVPLGRTGGGGTWALDPRDGGLVVVAGPARSGRTTTLNTVRSQARRAGLRVRMGLGHAAEDPSLAARGRLPRAAFPPGDPGEPAGRPGAPVRGGLADILLVDDVDRCGEAELLPLEEWLQSGAGPLADLLHPRATVVVAGSTSWFADGFRGLPALVRQSGRGVVLHAGRTDVRDVVGVRGGPAQLERRPGRGLLVERGQVRRVQLGTARPAPSAHASLARPLPSGVTPTGGPTA
jgi:S-DNA-T family DNA segregation ATPase FtsK/SpoIIIE